MVTIAEVFREDLEHRPTAALLPEPERRSDGVGYELGIRNGG